MKSLLVEMFQKGANGSGAVAIRAPSGSGHGHLRPPPPFELASFSPPTALIFCSGACTRAHVTAWGKSPLCRGPPVFGLGFLAQREQCLGPAAP